MKGDKSYVLILLIEKFNHIENV